MGGQGKLVLASAALAAALAILRAGVGAFDLAPAEVAVAPLHEEPEERPQPVDVVEPALGAARSARRSAVPEPGSRRELGAGRARASRGRVIVTKSARVLGEFPFVVPERDRALTGLVLLPDGSPAQGARVELEQEAGPDGAGRSFRGETDADGRFEFLRLTSAPCHLSAVLEDGRARDAHARRERWTARADGVLPGGGALLLQLDAGEVLRGRVLDATGAPVRRFTLRAFPLERRGDDPARDALVRSFASKDGRFELTGLARGRWSVSVRAFRHREAQPCEVVVPGAPPLAFELERCVELRGLVRLPDGTPAPRARVVATPLDGTLSDGDARRTDDAGRFDRLEVASGTWRVVAELGGMSSAVQLVTIAPGNEPAELSLMLRERPNPETVLPCVLTVDLREADGRVAAGRSVRIGTIRGTAVVSRTDGGGKARFRGLKEGSYEVCALDASGAIEASSEVELTAGVRSRVTLSIP